MSESARIATRHRAGSVGVLLGQRHSGHSAAPRDFKRANVLSLRQLQRQVKQQQIERSAPAPLDSFKLQQFERIPSRLHRTPARRLATPPSGTPWPPKMVDFATPPPRPQSQGPIASPQNRGARPSPPTPPSTGSPGTPPVRKVGPAPATPSPVTKPRFGRSASVGSPGAPSHALRKQPLEKEKAGSGRPPGQRIGVAAPRANPPSRRQPLQSQRSRSVGVEAHRSAGIPCEDARTVHPGLNVSSGEIHTAPAGAQWWPALRSSEIEDAKAAALRRKSDEPVVPAGYRLVPEDEKLEMRTSLRAKFAELEDRYARLPLTIETEGQRRQQQLLRIKIVETERALELFSRPGEVLVEA